jgi:uncharacterized protein (DUF305 family)
MKKLTLRRFSIASALVFSTASLTGCSLNLGDAIGAVVSQFSGADVMFAQMMIEHHEQAVELGTLAATRALSPEVKALAEEIKLEQAPEIAKMKSWLAEAQAPLQMGHSMVMDGMLSGAQMTALTEAAGAKFDELFLAGMIAHHKGAITMAKLVLDSGNEEVAAFASSVIESQTEQIERMQALLDIP